MQSITLAQNVHCKDFQKKSVVYFCGIHGLCSNLCVLQNLWTDRNRYCNVIQDFKIHYCTQHILCEYSSIQVRQDSSRSILNIKPRNIHGEACSTWPDTRSNLSENN